MVLAFVQAPAWGRDCPPYTMCYLAALIRRKGHTAHLFDLNNTLYHTSPAGLRLMWDDKDYYSYWEQPEPVSWLIGQNKGVVDFYVQRILDTAAPVICFTVHFSSVWASLEIARRIKDWDKGRIIVFGGPDCSRQQKGDFLIRQDCVDIVVHGEGEAPLFEIIEKAPGLGQAKSIKGCLTLRDGKIVDGGYAPGPKNLDDLPGPDYSDFRDDIKARMYREPHRLDIFDSRGCVNCCHFCSEWQFWGKFRSKSGKKIFEEVRQHVRDLPQVNYFYFIGSLMNGDMKALEAFCDLLLRNKLKIEWAGQAIIRPEMTLRLLRKMKEAGCVWIGYGIESGSQRVLEKMNKRFSLETAKKVLRHTREAAISTQVNFMFGLPTETMEDFNLTLDFLKDNRKYMDSILASQSFCVIDKGTYLYNHPEEFSIKGRGHHLYWESDDGKNNYPERFRRYEEFCRLALSMGVPETSGVLRAKPDKWQLLGDFFLHKRQYPQAAAHYLNACQHGEKDRTLLDRLSRCYEETGDYARSVEILDDSLKLASGGPGNSRISDENITAHIASLKTLADRLGSIPQTAQAPAFGDVSLLKSQDLARILKHFSNTGYKGVDLEKVLADLKFNEKQSSMSRALYSHGLWAKLSNYILADAQKSRKEPLLLGYPYWLVIDPCNYCTLHCPFCPTGQNRGTRTKGKLGLADFKDVIDKLGPYLIHVDLVNWGEPFLNEDVFEMVRYAKRHSADIKIDTNMNHFSEEAAEKLILSGLDKIVVSIDGLTPQTYGKYRRGGNFNSAMENLKLLLKKRKKLNSPKPYITWQFLVFRHNEHEVEEAIRTANKLGVDHIGITKAFIGDKDWIPENPEYSNYGQIKDRDMTFNHFKADEKRFCCWPWEAVAVNPNGSVSPCCSVEDESDDFGNFFDGPFEELWNGDKYRTARDFIRDKASAASADKHICVRCRHMGLINVDILSCHSFFNSL